MSLTHCPISKEHPAEILSYADSNHYLIRSLMPDNQYKLLVDKRDKPISFNGLHEAKLWLQGHGFSEALLRLETAYDEFIGTAQNETAVLKISLQ